MTDEIAIAIAGAFADRSAKLVHNLVTDDVAFRALLPGGLTERSGREDLAALVLDWFKDLDSVGLGDCRGHTVGDRLVVSYRLDLARGDHRWVVGQTVICAVEDDGRVSAMDLVCSGFRQP